MTNKEGIAPSSHRIKYCSKCDGELFVIVSRLFSDRFNRHSARIYGYGCVNCGAIYSIEGGESILDFGAYERAPFVNPIKR